MEVKPDTASEKADFVSHLLTEDTISVNKTVLDGEGTSKDSNSKELMDIARVIREGLLLAEYVIGLFSEHFIEELVKKDD